MDAEKSISNYEPIYDTETYPGPVDEGGKEEPYVEEFHDDVDEDDDLDLMDSFYVG